LKLFKHARATVHEATGAMEQIYGGTDQRQDELKRSPNRGIEQIVQGIEQVPHALASRCLVAPKNAILDAEHA
jgi:hypothetical protein